MCKVFDEIQKANRNNITDSKEINHRDDIRGVYGIFSVKDDEKIYLYIGIS